MGQTFTGLLRAVRARTGQGGGGTARPEPTAALRLCGDYLAGLAASGPMSDARQTRLVSAIGGLTTACGTDGDELFDALLRTGQRALEAGGETETRLALDIAVEATGLRSRSKGAWRLRGSALDALGRRDEAVEAYERHLALQQNPAAAEDIVRRIATLKDLEACLHEAAGLLPEADGTRLRALHNAPAGQARTAFAEVVRRHTAEGGGLADPGVRRLTTLYAAHRRLLDRDRMADPLLGGAEPLGVTALRRLVAGRSVCLVAGAPRIADEERVPGSALGKLIDGYDLVVRCDNLPAAGPRTDLHAVTLRGDTPWTGPVWNRRAGTRLVFGDPLPHWRRSLRARLVAGAQDRVGDASLRHPLDDPALLGEDGWGPRTGTAFTVLRLLDFLDAADRLDLIGFGLPGQLLPREREWVTARATHEDETEMRTTLR
ncbi:tetratricopeptide repeat protein [Streptomyces mutomycini]|uniref:Tetratricopeptide repeat protein n=1 Tax=Streptomyces mutomycini TaxID=284036 RepID=A0ABW0AXA3_9ACTN|nr:tetratricopeptide repeat protein [Streptomyces mutomycini]